MSELRDLTIVLRAFDKRLSGAEDILLVLLRDSKQQSEWRHEQRNRAMVEDGLREGQEQAMLQVQQECASINTQLGELVAQLDSYSRLRQEDVRRLNIRIGQLENPEEVTKS